MPLPKIEQPLFDVTIPSTGKTVKFRPFTVKEEKILLIAQESKDRTQIINAIKQIINNCVIDVDVNNLSTFDVEYLLINLRSKSVSNVTKVIITDKETNENVELELDLDDVEIIKDKHHNKSIQIGDQIYLEMKYPTLNQVEATAASEADKKTEVLYDVMMSCIDRLITEDEIYKMSDFTDSEVAEFINSLSSRNVEAIKQFFDTMPKLRLEKKYKNSNGNEKTFVVEGTESFFM